MSRLPAAALALLDGIRPYFPEAVAKEGEGLAAAGRVVFRMGSESHAEALVLTSPAWRVGLRYENEDLKVTCPCPDHRRKSHCAHVWATLVAALGKGYLTRACPDLEGGPARPRTSWRTIVASIRERSAYRDRIRGEGLPPGGQFLYWAELACAREKGVLQVALGLRRPRKNGGWTWPKTWPVSRRNVQALPDPEDRRIAGLLLGAEGEGDWGGYRDFHSFTLQESMVDTLVPALCRTGRFFLWSPTDRVEPSEPCAWDDGPPWELRLELAPVDGENACELRGTIRREGATMALEEPDLLLPGNILFVRNRASRFRLSGDWNWIPLLRKQGPIAVATDELREFVEEIYALPDPGGIELPAEARPAEIAGPPRPLLRVAPPKGGEAGNLLHAWLFFDYAGTRVAASENRRTLYWPAENRVLRRDSAAEEAARRALAELGFRRARADDPAPPPDYELDGRRLPRAVAALLERGWQVEGEQGLFRPPGRWRLSVSSGIDWFDLEGGVEYGETTVPFPRLLAALRAGQKFVRLGDGSMGILPEEWLRRRGVFLEAGEAAGDALRFHASQAVLLDALLAAEPEAAADATFETLRRTLRRFDGIEPRDPGAGFQGTLRPYQRVALGWMEFLRDAGLGGILADDMGLGKTVQLLAYLDASRGRRAGPALVVAPRSVVFNWKREAARFVPDLSVVEHAGSRRSQGAEAFAGADLVLTTYGILRRDAPFLKDVKFDLVALDEAQAIKNAASATAKAARLLKARQRLALSGTPIENHLGELWSLMEFLNPGLLGRASAFRRALEMGEATDAETRALLARALRPFILRRTKEQVAPELPERTEQTLAVELEPEERRRYDELKEHYRRKLLNGDAGEWRKAKFHVLEALLRLRQAACHPGLLDPALKDASGAKLEVLLERIGEVVAEGHKALVFSQFTTFLGIVRAALDRQGVPYAYLDGQTADRAAEVERFQKDPSCPVFLVSLKAGGLGLNLTAAEYVFLLDPWWNPAAEAQAIDRTHRIGQTRAVFACRLVAKGTVEEKVLELQKTKRELVEALLGEGGSLLGDLTREDLALLLS